MKKFTLLVAFLIGLTSYSQSKKQLIQSYLDLNKSKFELSSQDISDWTIISEVPGSGTGITSCNILQNYQGIQIFNSLSNASVKNGQVIDYGNNFRTNIGSKINTVTPTINAIQAATSAYSKLAISDIPNFIISETLATNDFKINDGLQEDPISAKLVYQSMPNKSLRLAWYLQFYSPDAKHAWDIRIDAVNGAILEKNDLMISCNFSKGNHKNHNHKENFDFSSSLFSVTNSALVPPVGNYRVVPYNYISPNHGPFQLVATAGNTLASPNGWHDVNTLTGTNAALRFTYSRGNNVLAQEDATGDNGSGVRAEGGATLNFDFPYTNGVSQTQQPTAYTSASTTNLFYMNNIMHDVWYQYGFNEASGNFQQNNLGRGGVASATGDAVFADSQDGWSQTTPTLNNANFAALNDGSRPRMQMFMWTAGAPPTNFININSPASIAGPRAATTNVFEGTDRIPVPVSPGITADLALYQNGPNPPGYNSACQTALNPLDLSGKIVLVRRGGCFFSNKVFRAQQANALAVIVMDSIPDNPLNLSMSSTGILGITIPAVFVKKEIGDALVAKLATEPVNATLGSPTDLYLYADGSFDNGIIAHEYGHGISNKLMGGSTSASCMTNFEQLGEGWSDWFSLMMQLKPGANATDNVYVGTYAVNEPTTTGPGIREFAYTTDMAVNPRTLNSSNNPDNSNTGYRYTIGETWATIMWDLTWAYIAKYGYDDDIYNGTGGNNKVMRLALDALKLHACNTSSFIIGRDKLFLADQATTGGQDYCLIAEVFARRGVGLNASSGDLGNSGDQVQDFTPFPPGPNCTLAINYFNSNDQIQVFPNPSNGLFNLKINKFVGKVSIQVIDINGRLVYNQPNTDFNAEKTIDLSAFQSGIYVLKVTGDNLNYSEKLIKN